MYLEACHDELLVAFKRTSAGGTHGGDLGENREQLIVNFINDNQPRRLYAHRGGQIIGVNSEPSKQIDVLVTHDSTIEFRKDEKSYRVAESILAAIAVKSVLDREPLKEDFENLASLPAISHDVLKLSSNQHDGLFQIYGRDFPARMMIGWDGAKSETLIDALNEAIAANPDVHVGAYPDVVTVLKRGFSLQLIGKQAFQKGQIERERVQYELVPEDHGPAWPLCWLLNQLSAGSGWAAMFTVDLQPYWTST